MAPPRSSRSPARPLQPLVPAPHPSSDRFLMLCAHS
jgi:hypothetical protein